jgi:hypothetical protein
MAPSKNTSKPKAPRDGSAKRAPATLRSTSGAGFEFEDLISAWQLVFFKPIAFQRLFQPDIDPVKL